MERSEKSTWNVKIVWVIITCVLIGVAGFGGYYSGVFQGFQSGYRYGYNVGYTVGYGEGIDDLIAKLREEGIADIQIHDLGNGTYSIEVISWAGYQLNIPLELHCIVTHWRPKGDLDGDGLIEWPEEFYVVSNSSHPMTLTNFGKDWIADKISGASSTNFLRNATWIGCSNDSSTVDVTWTILPGEITGAGLARAEADTVSDTGTGTWTISKTFSVTATAATKLYGLYLGPNDATYGNTLIAAEQQGVSNQKNLQDGDSLQITIQGSIGTT